MAQDSGERAPIRRQFKAGMAGATLAFAGLRNAADRAAVICLVERPRP